jgi:hypothetical protein
MAATHPAPAPPEERLRLAYRQLYRPGWPASFEAAMAHRTYSVCITGAARTLNRVSWSDRARRPTLPAAHVPPTPLHRGVDLKRLAANDKDD